MTTIVVPVYADWSSIKDCIESLKEHVDVKNKIILINDCGPEGDKLEKNIKQSIAGHKNFEYHRNPKNLGFIKTCNRAVLEIDKTNNDILLLNSDTKATSGFLEEMTEVLNSSKQIAVVSPRSNNATICTIPLSSAKDKGINLDKSYKIFNKIKNKLPRYSEVPTAHGFCMLIKRTIIKKYGLFDEVFGKGYGEENDFCMRIRKSGYKSVLANHAYVYHLEAKSFSLEAKAKMLEVNLKILHERWPEYKQMVRDYMEEALAREKKAEYSAGVKQNNKAHKLALKIKAKLKI